MIRLAHRAALATTLCDVALDDRQLLLAINGTNIGVLIKWVANAKRLHAHF